MSFRFAQDDGSALPLWLIGEGEGGPLWPEALGTEVQAWARSAGFRAKAGDLCLLPGAGGSLARALFGLGKPATTPVARERFTLGRAVAGLPGGHWRIAGAPEAWNAFEGALGWGLASYRFDRYKKPPSQPLPLLVAPEGVEAGRVEAMIAAEWLTRTLINTPASDMGPEALET